MSAISEPLPRSVRTAITVTLAVFLLMALCGKAFSISFVDPKKYNTPEFWRSLDSLYSDRAVVRILDETTVKVSKGGRVLLSRHILDAVLEPDKAEEYTWYTLPYSSAVGAKLGEFQARTINEDGNISQVGEKERIVHAAIEDFLLYSDDKHLTFSFPDVKPHSLLEAAWTIKPNSRIWHYDHWIGYAGVPTLNSRLEVTFPGKAGFQADQEDWSATCRTYGSVPEPLERFDKGKTTLVWVADNIPAINPESHCPPADYWRPRVTITPIGRKANAREFGKWYWKKLLGKRIVPSETLVRKAKDLVSPHESETAKVKALYSYVQKMRYVAIYLGKGGWQPHFADEIDEAGYGDCKDKATLLVALLRAAGISAYPALILARVHGQVERDIFDPGHFNHVIVLAEGAEGSYWLDPTARYCPSDRLPHVEQGVTTMVLREDGGYITQTPLRPLNGSEHGTRVSARLADDATIVLDCNEKLKFPESMRFRGICAGLGLMNVKRAYQDAWHRVNPDIEIDSLTIFEVDKPDSLFSVSYTVTIPYRRDKTQGRLFIPLDRILVLHPVPVFGAAERRCPIWLESYCGFEDTLEVLDPEGKATIEPEEGAFFEGPPGAFEIRTWRDGQRIMWVRKLIFRKKQFDASDYDSVRNFFSNVMLYMRRYRLIVEKD